MESLFKEAVKRVADPNLSVPSNAVKLELYACFKQATSGPCTTPCPSRFSVTNYAKWTAWNDLASISKEQAMKMYVQRVADLDSKFDATLPTAAPDEIVPNTESEAQTRPMESTSDDQTGFDRDEFKSEPLAGGVTPPTTHVFVLSGSYDAWSPRLELDPTSPVSEMAAALAHDKTVRTTAAEAMALGDREGDVLLFPQALRFRGVATTPEEATAFGADLARALGDVDAHDPESAAKALRVVGGHEAESVRERPHVFVCAHSSRDARCGACGPALLRAFAESAHKKRIARADLDVRACSHIGGHRYAGNAIVFRPVNSRSDIEVVGDWLAYVSPSDADDVVDMCISTDEMHPSSHAIHADLWRGRVGLEPNEHLDLVQGVSADCAACASSDKLEIEDIGLRLASSSTQSSPPRVLFVLGGPGSGKGTQCALLAANRGWIHLSAGDLLRAERADPASEHGALIEKHISEGSIVPVEITIALLLAEIRNPKHKKKCFLVDGFPRNADNLEGWERVVDPTEIIVAGVLAFTVPLDVLEKRLLERGKTSGRTDDNLEAIRKRFVTFHESSVPIVDVFKKRKQCVEIDGNRPVETVYAHVEKSVLPLMMGRAPTSPATPLRLKSKPKSPTNGVPQPAKSASRSVSAIGGNKAAVALLVAGAAGIVGMALFMKSNESSKK